MATAVLAKTAVPHQFEPDAAFRPTAKRPMTYTRGHCCPQSSHRDNSAVIFGAEHCPSPDSEGTSAVHSWPLLSMAAVPHHFEPNTALVPQGPVPHRFEPNTALRPTAKGPVPYTRPSSAVPPRLVRLPPVRGFRNHSSTARRSVPLRASVTA